MSREGAPRLGAVEAGDVMTDAVAHHLSAQPLPDLHHEASAPIEAEHRAIDRLVRHDAAVPGPDPVPLLLTESHRNDADRHGAHRSDAAVPPLALDPDQFRRSAAHRLLSAVVILHLRVGAVAGVYQDRGSNATAGPVLVRDQDPRDILGPLAALHRDALDEIAEALHLGGTSVGRGPRVVV